MRLMVHTIAKGPESLAAPEHTAVLAASAVPAE
jgi:hypothetical protein